MHRKNMNFVWRTAIVAAAMSSTLTIDAPALAQGGPAEPPRADMVVDAAQRRQVINALIRRVDEDYLFPEQARKIDEALSKHERHGDYDTVSGAQKLAETLTTQMQRITPDKHLYVRYSADAIPEQKQDDKPSPAEHAAELAQMKAHNYGIDRVERLPFNIGYLKLEGFLPARDAGAALTSAMNLLADTDALIFDLRDNFGGDQNTVALVASYLFDARTHLNDFYDAKTRRLDQMWTAEYVPGPRFGEGKDVYILTSGQTVSAAEDFSYALKNLKRAVIVGETSAGAAHCGDMVRLNAHFSAMIPSCRPISPITRTDWEGSGVAPDLSVPAKDALKTAQIQELRKMLTAAKSPARAARLRTRLAEVEKQHAEDAAP
ncbi:MAG: S41 family peptidase [Rudaea sp.]